MTTITIPRETFDAMREALEVLNHLDTDANFLNTTELEEMVDKALSAAKVVEPHTSGDYALGYAEGFNDACKPAAEAIVADKSAPREGNA